MPTDSEALLEDTSADVPTEKVKSPIVFTNQDGLSG